MKKKRIFILLCAVLVLAVAVIFSLMLDQSTEPDTSLFGHAYSRTGYAYSHIYENIIPDPSPEYYISEDGVLYVVDPASKDSETYAFQERSYKLRPFTLMKESFDDLLSEETGRWMIRGWDTETVRKLVRSAWYFETDTLLRGRMYEPRALVYYVLLLEDGTLLLGRGHGEVTVLGNHEHDLLIFDVLRAVS